MPHVRRARCLGVVGVGSQGAGVDDIPFLGSEALNRGDVTRNDQRTRFRPVFRDVYVGGDAHLTVTTKAHAAWLSTGATLAALGETRPRTRGIRRLRAALELVDGGAESPQESKVRLLLVAAGLPKVIIDRVTAKLRAAGCLI